MRRAGAALVFGLAGCTTPLVGPPAIVAAAETGSGAALAVKPVAVPTVMTFPFPFRGVKYQMTVQEGQSGVPGAVYADNTGSADGATVKVAVMNACAFIGRFPNPDMQGASAQGIWRFGEACL